MWREGQPLPYKQRECSPDTIIINFLFLFFKKLSKSPNLFSLFRVLQSRALKTHNETQ